MKQVLFGATDRINRSAGVFRGVNLCATLQHTTVNTAFAAGSPINWELVTITIDIKRKGGVHVVYSGPAAPLILSSAFYTAHLNQCLNLGTVVQVVYQVQTAGLKHILKQCAQVQFPEAISVQPGDDLRVELSPTAGSLLSTVDASAVSYVYFELIDAIANPVSLPQISADVVRASESNCPINGGNGVKKIYFINTDKAGITLANQIITAVTLGSDKLSRNDQYEELIGRRYESFFNTADADGRHQCFELMNTGREKLSPFDVWANNVNGSIAMASANVTASKNWVVIYRCKPDTNLASISRQRFQKHLDQNKAQYRA